MYTSLWYVLIKTEKKNAYCFCLLHNWESSIVLFIHHIWRSHLDLQWNHYSYFPLLQNALLVTLQSWWQSNEIGWFIQVARWVNNLIKSMTNWQSTKALLWGNLLYCMGLWVGLFLTVKNRCASVQLWWIYNEWIFLQIIIKTGIFF